MIFLPFVINKLVILHMILFGQPLESFYALVSIDDIFLIDMYSIDKFINEWKDVLTVYSIWILNFLRIN